MNRRKHDASTFASLAGLLALLLLVFAPPPAQASEPAGRVLASVGRVIATDADGNERTLSRNDVVYPGERITTGSRGRVQVRFRDDGLVDLKPSTEFAIEEYREPTAERGGSVVFGFLQGALRTITGAIGWDEGDDYQMRTSVATIGVRGTEYSLQYCDGECAEQNPPGLYGRVTRDSVIASNSYGSGRFGQGQYFFVPLEDEPRSLVVPPAGILDTAEDGRTIDRAAAAAERIAALPEGLRGEIMERIRAFLAAGGTVDAERLEAVFESADLTVEELEGGTTSSGGDSACCMSFSTTGSSGGFPIQSGFTTVIPIDDPASTDFDQQFTRDQNGVVRNIRFDNVSTGEAVELDFSGTPVQAQGSTRGVDWGLLVGGWEQIVDDGQGQVLSLPLDAGGLAFAVAEDLTSPTALGQRTGTGLYIPAGGPDAVDSLGNLWTVSDLQIGVDFTGGSASLDALQLDYTGAQGTEQVFTSSPVPIMLDTEISGVGAVFTDATTPVIADCFTASGCTEAPIDLVGVFVGSDGQTMSVTFGADLLDSGGLLLKEVGGVQVLLLE